MSAKKIIDDFFVCPSSQFQNSSFENLNLYFDFLKHLPEKYMKSADFNPSSIYSVLESTQDLFKKGTDDINSLAIYWLSLVKEKAELFCQNCSVPPFSFDENDMVVFAHMSEDQDNIRKLKELLFEHGVILIYCSNIPGMKVDGVSFLLDDKIPVVGMSLRYDRLDNYWFTLMHELAHIVLHFDLLRKPFVNDLDVDFYDDIEQEANGLAMKSLIPRYKWRSFLNHFNPRKEDIFSFAKEVGVHPAIVAGKYMREINNYSIFQEIVNCFSVRDALL